MIAEALIILYVRDQNRSAEFYKNVLGFEPRLHVPGMTEFKLPDGCILGLMPEAGIKKLLGDKLPDPVSANGIPRAELYLTVDDAAMYHARALVFGATELSSLSERDWGDRAAYSLDLDGHVLAFAEKVKNSA
jgi:catechol 2,3-dioxygenase-like lactoylglutathione lyase family enzyme